MTPEQQIELRLAALEEARNIFNNFNAHQLQQNRETNENLAILLGVTRSQGQDIKDMKADISSMKEDIALIQTDVAALKSDVAGMKEQLQTIITLLTSGTQPKPPEQGQP